MEIIQATIDASNFKFEIGAKKFEAEVQSISCLQNKQCFYSDRYPNRNPKVTNEKFI